MTSNVLAELMSAAVEQTELVPTLASASQKVVTVGPAVMLPLPASSLSNQTPPSGSRLMAPAPATEDCEIGATMPPEVDFDEDELAFEIGSAAVACADEFDEFNEFIDFDRVSQSSSVPSVPTTATNARPGDVAASCAPTPPATAKVATLTGAAALERDQRQLAAAAEEARLRVQEARANMEAHEARQRAARIQEEMANALRTVSQAVGSGADYGTISEKSAAEQADEMAASMRGVGQSINEDDEEEVEAGPTVALVSPPAAAAPSAAVGTSAREAKLMAQFEAATEAADASRRAKSSSTCLPGDERLKKILYDEASSELNQMDLSDQMQGIVREDWSQSSCWRQMFPALRPKLKNANLRAQRDRVLALARVSMGRSVLHERMLFSCYRALTGEATCPARMGPHWEQIGFQGNDPATDLRGAGMLGLLQLLHFAARRNQLLLQIYSLSRCGIEFPLMAISLNMTQLSLHALRSGALTPEANKSRQGVFEVFHSFYEAIFYYMYTEWKTRRLSIHEFGPVHPSPCLTPTQCPPSYQHHPAQLPFPTTPPSLASPPSFASPPTHFTPFRASPWPCYPTWQLKNQIATVARKRPSWLLRQLYAHGQPSVASGMSVEFT